MIKYKVKSLNKNKATTSTIVQNEFSTQKQRLCPSTFHNTNLKTFKQQCSDPKHFQAIKVRLLTQAHKLGHG